MKRNGRQTTVAVCAILAIAVFTSFSAFAEGDTLAEKIGRLKLELAAKEKEMEQETDIQKKIALGEDVKNKGLEIGTLTPEQELPFEEQVKNAEVDLMMQQQYLLASGNGKYKHLVEKLKPAHQIMKEVKENKKNKSKEQRLQDIEQVYQIIKVSMSEVNQLRQSN